jgi:hypothetical protein
MGHGKSTLATALVRRGWAYLSDELVPFDPSSGRVLPFPRMPMVRETAVSDMLRDKVPDLPKHEVEIPSDSICRQAVAVRTLVFPSFCFGDETTLTPCTPSEAALELLRHCLNFDAHEGRAVKIVCDLVERCPAFRLRFGDPDRAAGMIERLREASSRRQSSVQRYQA